MMDEDVFLDEAILEEDEAALLLLDRDEALASRLSRWKRPALPADLVSGCSRSVGTAPFAPTRSSPLSSWDSPRSVGSSVVLFSNVSWIGFWCFFLFTMSL
jgi:hypothetical protein